VSRRPPPHKLRRMTSLSKGFGLYARLEWGLGDIKFLSPQTFSGKKGDRTFTFTVHTEDYDKDFKVSIPNFKTNFLILFITNKEGDNVVLLQERQGWEWNGEKVSLEYIAKNLDKKWHARLKTPDILPDA